MEKLEGTSMNIVQDNIEKLKEIFPEIFTEGKIDFEVLKQLLGEKIETDKERYSFTWKGKAEARKIAQDTSTGTLRPSKEDSKDWDNTENLYIEGDNLEVLKLLQKSYHGKIKMIYIDPPYNTGKDFVYKDNFKDNLKNYLEVTGQLGEEGQRLSTNSDSSGRYHSDWLNMMYPRLKLARNLLTDDGVIFISIDDSEQGNLKKICDEIFGEENFINMVSVNMKNIAGASGGGEDKKLKKNIEYLLIYTKSYNLFNQFEGPYSYTEISDLIEKYKQEEISWKYNSILFYDGEKEYLQSITDGSGEEIRIFRRKNIEIKSVKKVSLEENISEKEVYKKYASKIFRTTNAQSSIRTRIINYKKENNIEDEILSIEYVPKSGKNKGEIYEQFYKGDNLFVWLRDTCEEIGDDLYKKDLVGTYWDYTGETKNLSKEGNISFPNGKKPKKLLQRLINIQTCQDDIILDFFSGSATTAHAVMQLNAEDGGNRKYIMVQLPEPCEEKSEAYKEGYKNICEIGKERIRRAGEKIKEEIEKENSQLKLGEESKKLPNIGFKVFNLDSSNIKEWDPETEDLKQSLFDSIDNIKPDRSSLDVLYEILLKYGLDLNVSIEENKNFYSIGGGTLLINLNKEIDMEVIDSICEEYRNLLEIDEDFKTTVVLRDSAFKNDVDKTNTMKKLEQSGIREVRSI